jgi:opacity protein-like surface antigen
MKIFAIAAAAAAVLASTAAFAKAEETSFQKDGYTYVYSVSEKGNTKHIRGKYYPGAHSFALEVRNGRVEGTVNDANVAFPLAAAATQSSGALASAQ